MRIINITPGLLPIPPNGWGAVEKIIWDYHIQFQRLGIKSEIKYLDEINYDENCVVHVHVANLANTLAERHIPYIFTIHDHHAYLYGKNSDVFRDNLAAIEHSIISLSPCKYFLPYFNNDKLQYFSHSVNTAVFNPIEKSKYDAPKLLCVANNGYACDQSIDRKGFALAIEAARLMNLSITIAGPDNNKKFFNTISDKLNNYDKLIKLYDLDEKALIDIYRTHDIFLHPSELEAGHPNLTLLEAMACGLPVVGTFEEPKYDGMIVTDRNVDQIVNGISTIISNQAEHRKMAIETAQKNSYQARVYELIGLYNKYRERIFATQFIDIYSTTSITHRKVENVIKCSFNDGAKVDISGPICRNYTVKFIDGHSGFVLYESNITNNMWAAAAHKYYIKWILEIYDTTDGENVLIERHVMDLKDKPVKIVLDTNSLGDTLAWVGSVNEFQKKHNCKLECIVFNEELRKIYIKNYNNITFLGLDIYSESCYAKYKIGYFNEDDKRFNCPHDPRKIGLCSIANSILGITDVEYKPNLSVPSEKPVQKYICIGTQSTCQAKYWNNPTGWDVVVDFLNKNGYEVWCIDQYNSFGACGKTNVIPNNCIDKTGDVPIDERIRQLAGSDFFIGLGSGLSWLAWATHIPVVLISGFSERYAEFATPHRVINESVCHGCWNNTSVKFDKSNWMWCPLNKNFECSEQISSDMVINQIKQLMQ